MYRLFRPFSILQSKQELNVSQEMKKKNDEN